MSGIRGRGKRGLSIKILKLSSMGHRQCEIARTLGCSTANVNGVLRRRGHNAETWLNRFDRTLKPAQREYLEETARDRRITVADRVRELLVEIVEQHMDEEAELRCLRTVKKLQNTPIRKTPLEPANRASGPA